MVMLCALSISACGDNAGASGGGTLRDFPLTLDVCGRQVTITKPPERVVLITRYTLPTLQDIGVISKIVAKSGEFPPELYDASTRAVLEKIPTIGGRESSTGDVSVSQEALLAERPDLVVGEQEAINVDALTESKIPFIPYSFADCPNPPPLYQKVTFESVYDQLNLYGRIFNRQQDEAAAAITNLKERVAKVTAAVSHTGAPRSAAALFVPVGGGDLYAGGEASMANTQMKAVGLTNVFGSLPGGTVKVGFESVLDKDPDFLIVLTTVDPDVAKAALLALPGARSLKAVREDHLLVMKFDYTDPPTPLSVVGLEKMAAALGSHQ